MRKDLTHPLNPLLFRREGEREDESGQISNIIEIITHKIGY